jgi:hypothetical protein
VTASQPTAAHDAVVARSTAGCDTHQAGDTSRDAVAATARSASRIIGGAICVIAIAFVGPVAAALGEVGGSTPTVQAASADAAWLAYAPAPAVPGVVCMVDSGVDPNPDTTAAVIGGQALSPDTGTLDEVAALSPRVQPGTHPDGHGTLMAMMMAAPRNGWGMVGIAPTSIRVYNMKAVPAGATTFPATEFYTAIEACQRLHEAVYPTMTVINLSLGGETAPEGEAQNNFRRAVASAREAGMSIVAAAGDTGANVLFPASYGPVLAVGAADAGEAPGTLCSFASRGEGLDLLAPACDTITGGLEAAFEDTGEPAYGSGASQASAEVSAVEESIDSYNPTLTTEQTEACLLETTQHGELDTAAAFDACGLRNIVQEGEQAEATQNPPAQASTSVQPAIAPATSPCALCATATVPVAIQGFEARCPRPTIHASRVGTRIRLQARKPPADCSLQVRVGSIVRGRMHWAHTYTATNAATLSVQAAAEIEVHLLGRAERRLSSPWTLVAVSHK